jgi:hypothetical protein
MRAQRLLCNRKRWRKVLGEEDIEQLMRRMKELEFNYQVKRSARRKTLAITVHPDNRIVVSVPATCPRKHIVQFVQNKSNWIRKAIETNLQRSRQNLAARFETGEKLLYLGREYILRVERGIPPDVVAKDGHIGVRLPFEGAAPDPSAVRSLLLNWYMERALDKVKDKVPFFADPMGVKPRFVTVKSMKSRWGSCSVHGRISLAWNIIMAPEQVLDYIIVHELCHMVHHKHSKQYWDLVATILPNHGQSRKWLRENGNRMRLS